jgi:hypothetical protein
VPETSSGWRDISTAPKDGTPVLLKFKDALSPNLDGFAGRQFVGSNRDNYMLWSFAAPVGCGGFPDDSLEGWKPLSDDPISWRYSSELMKLLEAAFSGDKKLASAYARLMADKMEQDGHFAAKYLRRRIEELEGTREAAYVYPAAAAKPDGLSE